MQNNDEETIYAVAFSYSRIIGPKTYEKLLRKFKTPKTAYHATSKKLTKIIGQEKTKKFEKFKETFKTDSVLNYLNKKSIQIINPRLPEWRKIFEYIHDLPIVFFSIGDISLLKNRDTIVLSVIGTRNPSPYGIFVTESFIKEFIKHNITILSGLALGIDSIAHKTCLNEGGKTIAILGSGIDLPYPSHHRNLYNKIITNGGLILSEYPPGTLPYPGNFVRRNRLISGLSDGLFVIEGAEKSGTLITGKYANEQGINVFAVPGSLTSKLSYAPHNLIQDGASLVTKPEDILNHYQIHYKIQPNTNESFSEIETTILDQISAVPQSSNQLFSSIQSKVKIQFPDLLSSLSNLEIKGIVKHAKNGKYYVQSKINSNPTPSIPP